MLKKYAVCVAFCCIGISGCDQSTEEIDTDAFIGTEGTDVMSGGKDNDVYIVHSSGGADIVKDAGGAADRIVFRDSIEMDDLTFTEEAAGLKVSVGKADEGTSILLVGWGQFDNYIEEFAVGGETFTAENIEERIVGIRRPKIMGRIPGQVARVGERFDFVIPDGVFVDTNSGGALKIGVKMKDGSRLPGWLTFHYTVFALFGTPGPDDIAEMQVVVTAINDKYLQASTESTITVRPAE